MFQVKKYHINIPLKHLTIDELKLCRQSKSYAAVTRERTESENSDIIQCIGIIVVRLIELVNGNPSDSIFMP